MMTLRDRIQRELKEGRDFLEIAKELTEGPRKEEGGDLGTINPSDLSEELATALATLKPGEVTEPIEQLFGLQWIKLIEIIPSHLPPLEEVKGNVYNLYLKESHQDKFDTFLNNLKERYYISEHRELLDHVLEQ